MNKNNNKISFNISIIIIIFSLIILTSIPIFCADIPSHKMEKSDNKIEKLKQQIIEFYKEGKYKEACQISSEYYSSFGNDEEFFNFFAISCLEANEINKILIPVNKLIYSPEARSNSLYFSTIFYQKKLLYHSLIDNVDIGYINLPKINYILSIVFDRFVKKDYIKNGNEYIFKTNKNPTENIAENFASEELIYVLGSTKDANVNKIYIKIIKNDKIIETKHYW